MCQSPPPDRRRTSSDVTSDTLSSSNLTQESAKEDKASILIEKAHAVKKVFEFHTRNAYFLFSKKGLPDKDCTPADV